MRVDLTGRRVLMLVWTGVSTDTRVLREASTLVGAGASVHVIGRAVPEGWVPPVGITVDSAGRAPSAAARRRELTAPERLGRWALLPIHVRRRYLAWQREAVSLARAWSTSVGAVPDLVHVHDFTALAAGVELAQQWDVPFVYDTHEYWVGRPVEGRPAPLIRRSEARAEAELASDAAAVVTVGDGVAGALRHDHPRWPEITVVRNTFPLRDDLGGCVGGGGGEPADPPRRLVYGGRLAAYRELEVIAEASERSALPITAVGPGDDEWLRTFDPKAVEVLPAEPLADLDARLRDAGAALVTHSDAWLNHRLAMPNKLFHAVSLGLPVVATDVGDLGALVREHDLGTLYAPGDADGLVRAVDELLAGHARFVRSVAAARGSLSWSADSDALLGVYGRVLGGR